MNKKIFIIKLLKRMDWLLGICVVGVIAAIYFSSEIAEHRMQALSFFIGMALVLWGIYTIIRKDFLYTLKMFKLESIIKKHSKSAELVGVILAVIGILLSVWGMLFWFAFIRNINNNLIK